MYITRLAENNLKESIHSRKIMMILGARQVGKTTLIEHFLRDKRTALLNLDIEVDKNKFLSCAALPPADALRSLNNPDYIVIDEAQRNTETSRIVKGWYDAGVHSKIILLGSSSLNLLHQSAESLTGRNEKIFLSPLLFEEIINCQPWYSKIYDDEHLRANFQSQVDTLLLQSLVYGNYPEAVLADDKSQFLLDLVSDYVLKDISQLGLIKTPELIKRLLMLLAYQAGSEVSINELSNNLGSARATVERYIELLEQTFVIFRLPAFSTNPRKEIMKNQKIYFWDNGVRNALLKEFSFSSIRSDIGLLWENWVVSEFAKSNLLRGQKRNLYFWRSRAGGEVDLIVKENERITAFEIKWKTQKLHKKAFENQYNIKVSEISGDRPIIHMN